MTALTMALLSTAACAATAPGTEDGESELAAAEGAADGPESETTASAESAYRSKNGPSFNGARKDAALVTSSLAGTASDGRALSKFTLDGAVLVGRDAKNAVVKGAGLVGAQLTATDVAGNKDTVRIDAVATHEAFADAALYTVSIKEDGKWVPMCTDATGARAPALALSGSWDMREGVVGGGKKTENANALTFACRDHAFAKCAEGLGYKPWAGHARQHAACVRLIRADYCGNGTSYTSAGNLVNVRDVVNVQKDGEAWMSEAEWDQDGARCVTKERATEIGLLTSAALLSLNAVPTCLFRLTNLACTAPSRATSEVLVSEVPLALKVTLPILNLNLTLH